MVLTSQLGLQKQTIRSMPRSIEQACHDNTQTRSLVAVGFTAVYKDDGRTVLDAVRCAQLRVSGACHAMRTQQSEDVQGRWCDRLNRGSALARVIDKTAHVAGGRRINESVTAIYREEVVIEAFAVVPLFQAVCMYPTCANACSTESGHTLAPCFTCKPGSAIGWQVYEPSSVQILVLRRSAGSRCAGLGACHLCVGAGHGREA
jgi:hypothetical protein